MEFSEEEIKFIQFCVDIDELSCKDTGCPQMHQCDFERKNYYCTSIPSTMRNSKELSQEQRSIISFFCHDPRWTDDCKIPPWRKRCPNYSFCNDEWVCKKLLEKLELPIPENLKRPVLKDQRILEHEIKKIILNNFSEIDWKLDESVTYYAHEEVIRTGRVDILLKGAKTLYVVELKGGIATREHVGQLLSYVGCYRENLPTGIEAVKGILLANDMDANCKMAIDACEAIEFRKLILKVEISL